MAITAISKKSKAKKEMPTIQDTTNPFQAMIQRFDIASKIIGLEQDVYNVIKNPSK